MSDASIAAAEEGARQALAAADIPLAENDSLPSRLIAIANRYDLPPHVVVLWIQQNRPNLVMDGRNFEKYCDRQRGGHGEDSGAT